MRKVHYISWVSPDKAVQKIKCSGFLRWCDDIVRSSNWSKVTCLRCLKKRGE